MTFLSSVIQRSTRRRESTQRLKTNRTQSIFLCKNSGGASTLSCDFVGPFQRCDLYFSNIPMECEGRGWDRVGPAARLVTLLSASVVRAGWSSTPLVVSLLSGSLVSMKRAGSSILLDALGVLVWCLWSSCFRELCHFPYGNLRELTISPTVK